MLQVLVTKLLRQLQKADADTGSCSIFTRLKSLDLYISFSLSKRNPEPTPIDLFTGVNPPPTGPSDPPGDPPNLSGDPPFPPPPPIVVVEDAEDHGEEGGLATQMDALP